ncbi:MAG TPA: hypothetical protein VFX94_08385 [Burkholderiales bacterium]|nr:hypothetical protein [Burkholderiales bacterium]
MSWMRLDAELARRCDAGRPARFWWRDDDAGAVQPEVKRLLRLASSSGVPVSLAVVPEAANAELFGLLHDGVTVLQHGTDHRNRAAAGEKKTEYPAAEPIEAALARASDGLGRLRAFAGARFCPVLAPPWNRVRSDLLDKLPAIGIRGLSMYGPGAKAEAAPGLRQVNTHVDIVAWREGKRFIGEEHAIGATLKILEREEPVGLLTHHAVHDCATWSFLERFLKTKNIRWLSAAEVFSYTAPAHV